MIEITLEGSFTARYGKHMVEKKKKSPIPVLVRELLATGSITDDTVIVVKRDDKEVFNHLPASYWAEYDYVECDRYGPRRTKFVEFTGF